ncbi:NADP-dependent isocitrate dehydrogenase [Acidobacteriia bacterium AH_259_A11_L15]|nr:NADP-dependent isocitrate dehydrogenase [Acidobacteriia bacterium AH_259_A11_L15]
MRDSYNGVPVPKDGQPIQFDPKTEEFKVPDRPIIPFIEGDGTGRDIWKASQRVFDAAVAQSCGGTGKRRVVWLELFAGEKAFRRFGTWLPDDTVEGIRDFRIAIKGPLTTPVGGGIRSLNVTLRQVLDLYACVRPVKWIPGVPSPVKHPERMNVIIFRENTEDVYAGIEWPAGSEEARQVIELVQQLGKEVRPDSGIGIKPVSRTATQKLVRKAIKYALEHGRTRVTLVHKGNIMKFTEGAFRDWGYELATTEFRDRIVTERESWILDNKDKNPDLSVDANAARVEPGLEKAAEEFKQKIYAEVKACLESIGKTHGNGKWKAKVMVNDRIADSMFQQVLTRANEYEVVCTPNLNGDYLSDACAAQTGGLGIAPGANIGDGYGLFEATHGTAPKYADRDVINPSSVMLSGALMFEFLGWKDVAELIEQGIARTIGQRMVTYDLERLMEGATKVKTSEYAARIIENILKL